MTKDVTLV